MSISFQLYSSRNTADQAAYLSALAAIGYTSVEGYGGVYGDPEGFAVALKAAGLSMLSGHFGIADLEADFDATAHVARTLGIEMIFAPYLDDADRPKDAVGWQALAARLAAIGEKATAAGFKFGWHNHDFEFVALQGGEIPMQILLEAAPDLMWEADLAWIARGGEEPGLWLETYADRILAIHVKDIAPAGEKADEDGWADVGTGTMDWRGLIALQRRVAPKALCVMEHDNPSDITRFARVSFNNFEGL